MHTPEQVAKHFKEVFFGGNWTFSNVKEVLADVSWQEAVTPVHGLNSIAVLTYHIHYFVRAQLMVLQGKPLEANDRFSFDCPPIQNQEDWDRLRHQLLADAEKEAALIGQLPPERLWQPFEQEKYGTWYRNLHGITEHTHYHLGQIAVIKKIIKSWDGTPK